MDSSFPSPLVVAVVSMAKIKLNLKTIERLDISLVPFSVRRWTPSKLLRLSWALA